MNRVYTQRVEALTSALHQEFGDAAQILGDASGLHIAAQIRGGYFDESFQEKCLNNSLSITPCSSYSFSCSKYSNTLVLGYGNIEIESIKDGIALLKKIYIQIGQSNVLYKLRSNYTKSETFPAAKISSSQL